MPAIVSNVTVPLLGICDTAISGHLGSELYLAAIAVGSVMLNVVFWIFGFLRGGTTGLTAIAFGAENEEDISKVLFRSLTIAITAGIILILFQIPLFKFLSWIVGSGTDIENYTRSYFSIRIWGSPALLATMAISGWFIGMQTTFFPMLIAIGMNIINIIVSFILVFIFDYGFNGVAAGTLISNWIGLAGAIIILIWFRRGKTLNCGFHQLLKGDLWKYFSINGNLFLRSFFIICVTMGVTSAGARLGSLTLAINVIIMQFFQFFSFFMDGFAFSGEAIVGLRLGERNIALLKKSVRRLLLLTCYVGVLFSIFYFLGSETITNLLTDSHDVRTGVVSLNLWITLIPIVSCWAFIYDGFYIGLTKTREMMVSTFIASITFFCITFLSIENNKIILGVTGNTMIWMGFLSYLLIRGVYLASRWKKSLNKSINFC